MAGEESNPWMLSNTVGAQWSIRDGTSMTDADTHNATSESQPILDGNTRLAEYNSHLEAELQQLRQQLQNTQQQQQHVQQSEETVLPPVRPRKRTAAPQMLSHDEWSLRQKLKQYQVPDFDERLDLENLLLWQHSVEHYVHLARLDDREAVDLATSFLVSEYITHRYTHHASYIWSRLAIGRLIAPDGMVPNNCIQDIYGKVEFSFTADSGSPSVRFLWALVCLCAYPRLLHQLARPDHMQ